MNIQDIKIGEGLGEVKFGMTREQVSSILGQPDDIDQYSDSDLEDDSSESWHYDELEISLSFDEDADWKLVTIAVSAPNYKLDNKELIGLEGEEVIKVLESLNLGSHETEDWSSEEIPDHKLISFTDSQINFWVEDGELTEIQWGPLFIDEETIKWPN